MNIQPESLGKSKNFVLVKYPDGNHVIVDANTLPNLPKKLPSFNTEEHRKILRSGGYSRIRTGKWLPYGQKSKLYLFEILMENDIPRVFWLNKKAFIDCFPGITGVGERFESDAANNTWGRMLDGDGQGDRDDDEENDIEAGVMESVEEVPGHRNSAFGQAAYSAGYPSLTSAVGQIRQPAPVGQTAQSMEYSNVLPAVAQIGQPAGSTRPIPPAPQAVQPGGNNIVQQGLSGHQNSPFNGNGDEIIYARKTKKAILQGIIKRTDGSFDMKKVEESETDMINNEDPRNTGYVPKGDRRFINRICTDGHKDRRHYEILGCVGFTRESQVWKVVILKFKSEFGPLIQSFREESIYKGPVLCPWTAFESNLGGDTGKANGYFEKTTLGLELASEGIEARSVRHKTLEPKGSESYNESKYVKVLAGRLDNVEDLLQKILAKL